jgi:beta-glucosidase/6-phospho-beta-glucosidase/beta-galactosidase
MSGFMFATGIENSYPTIRVNGQKRRVDEMEKAHHYTRWREDFDLVEELGIQYLRYGPPYYSTHLGAHRYDWSFCDETMNDLRRRGIEPIVDLCHFGVPDWIGDFQNPDFPHLFAQYAQDFAIRYPWVTLYTPVNEIFIAAMFSARYGWWNECMTDDRAFVTAIKHLCQANVLAMGAITATIDEPIFIQSESSEYFHPEGPDCIERANFLNEKRFLSLDLSYGRPVSVKIYEYLLENGMTPDEYHWFERQNVKALCILGNDYYVTNEHLVLKDGTTRASGEIFGYYVITSQYYQRYRLPVMHTETNIVSDQVTWLHKQWANLYRLRQDGVPVLGFTWYSLIDQVDWDTALREDRGHIHKVGLCDMDRKPREVGLAYKQLIHDWHDLLPTETRGLRLKHSVLAPH